MVLRGDECVFGLAYKDMMARMSVGYTWALKTKQNTFKPPEDVFLDGVIDLLVLM